MIFETKRLKVRKAEIIDVEMYSRLWNSPKVMYNVGFPQGLNISSEKIAEIIGNNDETEFNQSLVVIEKSSGKSIGECKLGLPNGEGISSTDVKLFPEFWGNGYGKEIKNALCLYLFSNTSAKIVKADPNVKNIASQKMQEACGGVRVDKSTYHFPEKMKDFTEDVHSIIYHIHKKKWLKKNLEILQIENDKEKQRVCEKVLRTLPEWFGIDEATQEYIDNVAGTMFFVAKMSGEVVGFYSIISHFPQTSEIFVCGILPKYHRLGIGRELQKQVESQLIKNNVKYLTVKTLSSSHPDKGYAKTREFYKACGFVPVEEFKTLWGAENPCLFLIKKL
ncbi:MAG: GNAT family N-acetyltransferase [Candidatus Cloacimonetes bacterium]|nr:GNAT family N-acetyltransferase [Candidatus Cloacimonadota bacterium]